MFDKESLHKRMIELCDCYAETDPLREMAMLPKDTDKEEAALKWLALAVLHGVDRNAKEISLLRTSDGKVKVVAEYRPGELPSPGPEIGKGIIDAVRDITHIEADKGEIALAVGIRDSNVEVLAKIKRKDGEDEVVLKFGK